MITLNVGDFIRIGSKFGGYDLALITAILPNRQIEVRMNYTTIVFDVPVSETEEIKT